jgi:hypothetical protein
LKEIITFEQPDKVYLTFEGILPPEAVEGLIDKWNAFIKPGQKSRVMIDASNLEDVPPESREALRAFGSKFPMTKLAVVGASTKIRILGGLIIKLLPGIEESRFLNSKEEALTWLDEGK